MTKSSGRVFMQATRHEELDDSDQQQGLPAPPLMAMLGEIKANIDLPRAETTELACPEFPKLVDQRRSRRRYLEQALSLTELSYLLWCSQGVQTVHGRMATMRTVPGR